MDGVAVVSDIMASREPHAAAQSLATLIRGFYRSPYWTDVPAPRATYTVEYIKSSVGEILASVKKFSPLVHQVRISKDRRSIWCIDAILKMSADHE